MLSLTCASCGKIQDPAPDGTPAITRCPDCSGILVVSATDVVRRDAPAERPALPEAPALPGDIPSSFGKYRLDRMIGRGGMAAVYDARDTRLDRRVALKIMSVTKSDDPKLLTESWKRFTQEARLGANLPKHPNICTVYEAGVVEDRHRFIAMEYVQGRPFSEWRTAPPKPLSEKIRVLRDVALAAHCAHEQGIIHRDLKPGNILVGEDGRPVVTDFGLAKSLAAGRAPSLTPTGFIVGSPAYMSPEQALGRDEVDRRTDVYALGAMLYEVLVGRPPADGKSPVEVLSKVVEGRIESPAERMKAMSAAPPDPVLERICLKAMARHPHARYPTAQAFADELSRWLGAGAAAAPAAPRRFGWIAAAGAAAVLLLAAAVYFLAKPDPPSEKARVHVEQGQDLLKAGRIREAVGAFEKALSVDPSNPAALRGRDEGLRKLEAAAEAAPKAPIVVDLATLKPTETQGIFYRYNKTHAHIGSNLTAETSVALRESGEYEIVVTAGCEAAKGEFAKFRLHVDGKSLGETALTAVEAKEYRVKAALTAGHRRLGIEFTNDLYEPDTKVDRNLHVHAIVLRRAR